MRWRRRTLFFLILVLYAGFIVGLLYIEFFAKTFSHSVGELHVTGHYAPWPLGAERRIRDVTVSFNGMELRFNRPKSEAAPSEAASLRVESWRSLSEGGEIGFERDRVLRIQRTAEDPPAFSFTMVQKAPAAAVWRMPFRATGSLLPTEGRTPILSWEHGKGAFYLSLPIGSRVDTDSSVLLVRTDDRSGSAMRLSAAEEARTNAYTYWQSQEESLPTEEAFRKAVGDFLDAAWNGWSRTRLSPDGSLWSYRDGNPGFREETGNAFLAESMERNSFPWARNVYAIGWAAWRLRNPAEVPEATGSAYIGNLADLARRTQARDPAELARLGGLLASADTALLSTPRLIPYLLDHGPFSMVQQALSFLQEKAASAMDLERTLGAVEACLDAAEYVDGGFADRARAVVERSLLPMVRKTDLGVFLVQAGETEKADILSSLRGGSLLLRAGESWDLPVLRSIGRGLVVSGLSLKADEGYLPASLAVSGKNAAVTGREGSLAPETVHPLVAVNRFIPRETPLSRSFEPGVWIWTAAKVAAAENAAGESRFVLSFPVGNAHFSLIQGVKPFKALRMHDLAWNSDPAFAQYSDGWVYDAAAQTLYLKLTHRQEKEELRIQY